MENNNENTNNQQNKNNKQYEGNPLTGMLGVGLFFIVMLIIMLVLMHFRP